MTANSWTGRSRFNASPCQLQSHEEDMSRDAQLAGITGFLVRPGLSQFLCCVCVVAQKERPARCTHRLQQHACRSSP